MKNFNIIAAVSLNGVIGNSESNSIPWNISADLKYFREKTLNHTVIMGSNTLRSMGKGLKNRKNVIISKDSNIVYKYENTDKVYMSLYDAISCEEENSFIIGGSRIYSESLRLLPKKIFITIVNKNVVGDVLFPIAGYHFLEDNLKIIDGAVYNCVSRSKWFMENNNEFQFTEFQKENSNIF